MYFKHFFLKIFSQIRSLLLIFLNIFEKSETRLYPEENLRLSSRYRGRIILTCTPNGEERCVACGLCAAVCPVGCIALEKTEQKNGRWFSKFFRINFSRCIFCGLCEEACPTAAIQLIPDVELGDFKRKNLIYEKNNLLISGTGKKKKYDYYVFSGVTLKNVSMGKKLHRKNKIDIKSLLP
ncbi:NADH-quinone oxidoreductase subunit NuoI [Buchnera aphidicola]|uniref:NADH-quinone oxidoreductase subunit I n=1 Tax=Buchnera aphidicola subsp. Tuberolachnus salignus TaxID=98804 RepID=A0A160SXA1_BUCTT|nr:NADH-quinone oxidoreductase subunit NuoI [Buchnera aphidicola]CUR53095.1 NADH-quinone oxidoreductase subunit I [Buchnera aphidicola (Tuberolachnus salignus)]